MSSRSCNDSEHSPLCNDGDTPLYTDITGEEPGAGTQDGNTTAVGRVGRLPRSYPARVHVSHDARRVRISPWSSRHGRRVQIFAVGHFLSHWCCRYPVLQH